MIERFGNRYEYELTICPNLGKTFLHLNTKILRATHSRVLTTNRKDIISTERPITRASAVPGKHIGRDTTRRVGHGRLTALRPDVLKGQRLAPMCRRRAVRAPSGILFHFAIIITPAMAQVLRWTVPRPSRRQIAVKLVDIKQ